MGGHPVVRLALFVKQPKAFGVGEEWTRGIIFSEATAQFVERSVKVDDPDAGRFQQCAISGLDERSAAERNDGWVAVVERVEELGECLGLHLAKCVFAEFAEDVRDSTTAASFDLSVEVDEAPAEALRKSHSDGSLAGAHEADEEYSTGSVGVAASNGLRLDRHLLHLRLGLSEIPYCGFNHPANR